MLGSNVMLHMQAGLSDPRMLIEIEVTDRCARLFASLFPVILTAPNRERVCLHVVPDCTVSATLLGYPSKVIIALVKRSKRNQPASSMLAG